MHGEGDKCLCIYIFFLFILLGCGFSNCVILMCVCGGAVWKAKMVFGGLCGGRGD